MQQLFPYAHIVTGILVLIIGFVFHWIGQLVSIINWEYATKIGLQEKGMPQEFFVYENATAKADVFIGWIYGLVGIGLLFDLDWSYKLLWLPGVVFVYHSLNYWFWTSNQTKLGQKMVGKGFKIAWTFANLLPGLLAIVVAWHASR